MTSPFQFRHAARLLHQGGVIAYPTEAVFGLGCDPLNRVAFDHLLQIKGRAAAKGVILIAATLEQLAPYLDPGVALRPEIAASWPGPHTWVVAAHPHCPAWLTGGRTTIAVRVTAHVAAAALCSAFGGAIVSTSANRSGQPPIRRVAQLQRQLGSEVDMLLHAPLGGLQSATAIRDGDSGALLRAAR